MSLIVTTYNDIIKNLRAKVIEVSELDGKQVRNLDGLQGADLQKLISNTKSQSIEMSDMLILFELTESDEMNYIEEGELSNGYRTMNEISSYKFSMHLYGQSCHTLSKVIYSRFKTDDVLNDLYDKGIWITGFDNVEYVKEFINNTLWQRCDIAFRLTAVHNIKLLSEEGYIDESSLNLNIKRF